MATTIESIMGGEKRFESPRIPAGRYPIDHSFGEFDYEQNKVSVLNRVALRRRAYPFERLLSSDQIIASNKIVSYMQDGDEVIFAKTRGSEPMDVGLVTYRTKIVRVGEQLLKVQNPGIRVVLEDFQKMGIATHLAVHELIDHRPDVVVGKTRMWDIINMWQDTRLIADYAPLTRRHTLQMQEAISLFIDKATIAAAPDLGNGVFKGMYEPKTLEEVTPPASNERGVANYLRMRELGLEPEKGDGLIYYLIVDQATIQTMIEEGYYTKIVPVQILPLPAITRERFQ